MAYPNVILIEALRETARKLNEGNYYAWGNHGSCNCGNLLQVLTKLDSKEILQYSRTGTGEWTEMAIVFCGTTNAPVDLLLKKLEDTGLTSSDIHCIEYLEDREVLNRLPGGFRWLRRNVREDVIVYFETMAEMLEEKLLLEVEVNFEKLFSLDPLPQSAQ